jgi:asparagine synthase (glutamine-hydrolysing)
LRDTEIFAERDKHALFHRDDIEDINHYDAFESLYGLRDRNFQNAIEAACYCDLINYVGSHQVYRTDQFTMRYSLEGRFPLLDHELIELAFRMPSHLKVRGKTTKYALREVARRHIAPESIDFPKAGFSVPLHAWVDGELRPVVDEKMKRLRERDLFRTDVLDRFQREYQNGQRNWHDIWQLVSIELWMEALVDPCTANQAA